MTCPYGFVDTCCEKHDNCYLDKDDMTPKQEAALQAITDFDQMREATEVLARRIKELEVELMEQARVNGMGGEREAKLMARVERLEAALDVALEALENSRGLEPVDVQWVKGQRKAAIATLKEMRRDDR